MFAKSNGFGPKALILLNFPPYLGSFFESEFLLVGNPQEVKDSLENARKIDENALFFVDF